MKKSIMYREKSLTNASDATDCQRCCDLYGREISVQLVARGQQPSPQFPRSISDPEPWCEAEDSAYLKRKTKILRDLDPLEQAIFVLIHEERCTRAETARRLNISRPTLYLHIGRMLEKSKYCRISFEVGGLRPRKNQYE